MQRVSERLAGGRGLFFGGLLVIAARGGGDRASGGRGAVRAWVAVLAARVPPRGEGDAGAPRPRQRHGTAAGVPTAPPPSPVAPRRRWRRLPLAGACGGMRGVRGGGGGRGTAGWPAPWDAAGVHRGALGPWSRRAPPVPAWPAGRRRGACRVAASPRRRRPPRPPAYALSLARHAVPAEAAAGVARPPRDLLGGCVGRWRCATAHKRNDGSGGGGRGRPKAPPLAAGATRWPGLGYSLVPARPLPGTEK